METIKAVEMVRQIRDRQYELTKHMTVLEWKTYIHQAATELNAAALEFLNRRRVTGSLKRDVKQS